MLGSCFRGAADAGEVLATAARIKDGDADSWLREWVSSLKLPDFARGDRAGCLLKALGFASEIARPPPIPNGAVSQAASSSRRLWTVVVCASQHARESVGSHAGGCSARLVAGTSSPRAAMRHIATQKVAMANQVVGIRMKSM